MTFDPSFLITSFFLAVPLSWCATWLLAARYRVTMKRLMSAKAPPPGLAIAGTPAALAPLEAEGTSHAAVSLSDNRRAGWVLTALLTLLSLVIALSSTVLNAAVFSKAQMAIGADPKVVSFWAMLQINLLGTVLQNWWPAIPALGLLWRWRAWQVLGATLTYWLLCFAVEAVSVGIRDPISAVEYLAMFSGIPLLALGLLCLAPTTRAITPWLLPLIWLLLAGSLAGMDLLDVLLDRTHWLKPAYDAIGGLGVMITFYVLLPWLLAWWPIRLLGRALARAYALKWLSETMVLFGAVWIFGLIVAGLGFFPTTYGSWCRTCCCWRGSHRECSSTAACCPPAEKVDRRCCSCCACSSTTRRCSICSTT
jgi:hypothetical protein